VDFTGQMKKEEIIEMLKARARRTEISFEDYQKWRVANLQVM